MMDPPSESTIAAKHSTGISLEIDDAFSDGDDVGPDFHFTSDSLRHELAANPTVNQEWLDAQYEAEDLAAKIGVSQDVEDDAGVTRSESPAEEHSLALSPQASPEPGDGDDIGIGSKFSTINLDDEVPGDVEPEPSIHVEPAPPVSTTSSEDELPPGSEDSTSQRSATPSDGAYSPRSAPASTPNLPRTSADSPPSTPATATFADGPRSAGLPPTPSSSASASGAPAASPTSPRHRVTRSIGPSIFQKVVSKTRPTYLPPKPKVEDRKHMADWERMMRRSRLAEEKRRKAAEERRIARDKQVEESVHIWQKEIMPDWKSVYKNPALRKLWWAGIPTSLRATMWERAVGNPLALNKDNYRTCLARAKRAIASHTFSAATLDQIEQDILTTVPSLHIFHPETGPLYEDLKNMLQAWVVSRSDEGLGYAPGIARIAGMVLINMPVNQGFIVMRNLLERHCMRSFYGGAATKDDVEAYYRIFDTLLADGMPKIYFNFKQHQISPAAYLPEWLVPLFLDHLPFDACARVWDVILLEGDAFLFRAALAVLGVLEPRLFFPDRRELLELLQGKNKAALEVAKRDGRSLDGGKYEIYGVDEETLWERIDAMDEWWKESTWTRLLSRELPDI